MAAPRRAGSLLATSLPPMGRGDRSTVRWKHDRIRAKKRRTKRKAVAHQAARTTTS